MDLSAHRHRSAALCVFAVLVLAHASRQEQGSTAAAVGRVPDLEQDRRHRGRLNRAVVPAFVPNLGQWKHSACFVHKNGPITLFLQDHGWVACLREVSKSQRPPGEVDGDDQTIGRSVSIQMTFEGAAGNAKVSGEAKLQGSHNYYLGNDWRRWRTGVPLFQSVRYDNLYPGIGMQVREARGVPEYDLLLEPGADLASARVQVSGATRLTIGSDGSLVIHTAIGRLIQPRPVTREVREDGSTREVACDFRLLGSGRFGFEVPEWRGDTSLTVDPGLIWSSFLGGNYGDAVTAMAVDANGLATVVGSTASVGFPTTIGAYETTYASNSDAFVTCLDPGKVGAAQLVYSTFLGGSGSDVANSLAVDLDGLVTVTGSTTSADFPTTGNTYDSTFNGGRGDAFVSCLIPAPLGRIGLRYSTYLGGADVDADGIGAIFVDANGVITLANRTQSTDFPTTPGAYDRSHNGTTRPAGRFTDVFISQLDPRRKGSAQLVYSTFLGGSRQDHVSGLTVDKAGVITVAGSTGSMNFPITASAYDSVTNGSEAFVSQLDPSKTGAAQLVYSTFLGGRGQECVTAFSVGTDGVITLAGFASYDFPVTPGAYDVTFNGYIDCFVSRLDLRKKGLGQLTYSTYLGGGEYDEPTAVHVDENGIVTLAGKTWSPDFPTTTGAYDTTYNGGVYTSGGDGFICRLHIGDTGNTRLVYSTFFGGKDRDGDMGVALGVDPSGVATVSGRTDSIDFPVTPGAFDTVYSGRPYWGGRLTDCFVSRFDMGVSLYASIHEIELGKGGSQGFTLNAGSVHANESYWLMGSVTGTAPGVNLSGVHVPLNPDFYTGLAIDHVNSAIFTGFRGKLDSSGLATASLNVPANLPLPKGLVFHHAYIVYDSTGKIHMASQAVPLRLR